MPRISCPKCDARVKIPEDYDRPSIKCPTCGKKIPLGDDDDDMPPPKAEKKPSGMGGCLAIGAYSVTILAIIACIAVAFLFPPAAFVMAILVGVATAIIASIAGMIAYFVAMSQRRNKFMAYLPWFGLMVLGALTAASPPTLLSIGKKAGWFEDDAGKGLAQGNKDGKEKVINDDGGKDKGAKVVDIGAKVDKEQKPPIVDKNAKIDKDKKPPIERKPLKMTGDAALDAKLNDIASPDGKRSKIAADSLAIMEPNEHRAIVAQNLMEITRTGHPTHRTPILRALGKWGTAEEVPPLITLLTDADINTRNETLQALGRIKDERAVAPMVKCLLDVPTQSNAETALKAMGPIAEKDVIGLLMTNKGPPRLAAIRILSEIGTEASIPALEDASKTVGVRATAQKAIAAINLRLKK